ncbi:hypothetical protein Q1695_000991 [Nippostrongylus brasiliensis]|nr:hypothetical protein Q1695_000991 [Nippostrongylus brasiliensis]
MWELYDHLFSAIYWTTGSVGIIVNVYLIYLIIFNSPETLKVYRVFLANAAISDLVFALATTFAQIRLIPNKWAFAYVTLGPASYLGSKVRMSLSFVDVDNYKKSSRIQVKADQAFAREND